MNSAQAAVHYSSKTPEWSTPQDLFDELNKEFNFTLDVCATPENAKCVHYYTRDTDGLAREWGMETVWCNPPYGRGIAAWVRKCALRRFSGAVSVMLLPARTDTKWWHDHIWDAVEHHPRVDVDVRFIKGRLKFGGSKNSAPFPSVVVVFR